MKPAKEWHAEDHSARGCYAASVEWIAAVQADARTDIPALLEEVDRLCAENAKLLTHNVDAIQTSVEALKFSEDMRAEGRREGLRRAAELCDEYAEEHCAKMKPHPLAGEYYGHLAEGASDVGDRIRAELKGEG